MKSKSLIYIESKEVAIGVDKTNGFIRSLIFKNKKIDLFQQLRQNIPGYVSQVRVFDELKGVWYNGLMQKPVIKKFKSTTKAISYELTFANAAFTLEVKLGFDKGFFRWQIKGRKINSKQENRSLRIIFDLPLIAGWDVFAPCAAGNFKYDGMTSFDFNHIQVPYVSPNDIILPMVTHYSKVLDVGYSMVSPVGLQTPALRFQCLNADKNFNWGAMKKPLHTIPTLEAMFYYIGLVDNRPMHTELQVCFHEGDFRPAVGKVYNKWQEYFMPVSNVIYQYQGVFNCHTADGSKDAKLFKELKTTTYEVHGHFEHYGDYYQEGKESWLKLSIKEGAFRKYFKDKSPEDLQMYFDTHTDDEIYSQFEEYIKTQSDFYSPSHPRGTSQIRNFREDIKSYLKEFRKHGIGPYWYFNYTDGFRPYVEKNFSDSIAKNEDGSYQPSGWFYCHNMNADPRYSFGKHMIKSAERIIKNYPQLTGFFLDCFRHFEIDFAHDDGITVVNHKPAYSMNFSYDKIEKHIKNKIFNPKKHASFANKPQSIRSMRYVDGVLLEGDGPIAEAKYFWTCLAKPLFFMWTSNHESLDFNLKRAVLSGCFPRFDFSKDHGSPKEIKSLYQKYLPIYEAFRRRVYCFEADPIRAPKGSIAQLFTVAGDYVASIINENISSYDQIRWAKTPYTVYRVKHGADVGRVSMMVPGQNKWENIDFKFDGTFIYVPMKNYKNCAVIKLHVNRKTGKQIGPQKFKEGVDYCGDPSSSFDDISKR